MAQSDNPYGLTPYGILYPPVMYREKSGAAFKLGDPLLDSTGANFGTTNSTYIGVAAQDSTGTALGDVAIWCHPEQLYVVKANGDSTSLAMFAGIDLSGTTGAVVAAPGTTTNADVLFCGYPYGNEDRTATGHRILVKFNIHKGTPASNAT